MARKSEGLSPDMQRVRDNLKRFRVNWDLKQEEAAIRSGLSVDDWRRYERGQFATPIEKLKLIAEFFKTPIDEFFSEDPRLPPVEWRPFFYFRADETQLSDPRARARAQEMAENISRELEKFEKELREIKKGE